MAIRRNKSKSPQKTVHHNRKFKSIMLETRVVSEPYPTTVAMLTIHKWSWDLCLVKKTSYGRWKARLGRNVVTVAMDPKSQSSSYHDLFGFLQLLTFASKRCNNIDISKGGTHLLRHFFRATICPNLICRNRMPKKNVQLASYKHPFKTADLIWAIR